MQSLSFKISSGRDLLSSLLTISKNENKDFFVLSIVGNLSRATFECPGQKDPVIVEEELEILSLNGFITNDKAHLHLCVSNSNCQAFGGHILKGTIVAKNVDILLGCDYSVSNVSFFQAEHSSITNQKVFIEVYILKNCPWSKRAIRFLNNLGLKFDVHEINNDDDFKTLYKRSKYYKFPQIFFDNKFIGGYDNLIKLSEDGKLI